VSRRHLPGPLALTAAAALLLCAPGAGAALLLNPGDTYIAAFTELPESSVGYHGYAPSGGFWFELTDFDPQSVRLEFFMFEETPDNLSVASAVAEAPTDGTAMADAFADYDGGAYFHMLAGSVTLESITFWYQEPIAGDDVNVLQHRLTVIPTPAPEPGGAAVVALTACAGAVRRRQRRDISRCRQPRSPYHPSARITR
jgi:hypothetical protein